MKIKNLFNPNSVAKVTSLQFADSVRKLILADRELADSVTGIVLARNLTQVDPRIYEKRYPDLAFVNSGVAADNSGGFASRIQSLRLLKQGAFRTAGDTSSTKGKVSVTAEDNSLAVIEKEAEASYTDTQVQQADLQNVNLVSELVGGLNETYLREVDAAGFLGVPDLKQDYGSGLVASGGLLNHPSINASGAGATITKTSAAQTDFDTIAGVITDQQTAVNNTPGYAANRCVLPVSTTLILSRKLLNTGNASNITVLQALKNNFPDITFSSTFRAESVSGTKRMVVYSNAEDVMKFRLPLALTVGEVIRLGSFNFKVDAKYRVAGLDLLEATGARIATGL